MRLEWQPNIIAHYDLGFVYESIHVKGQLIKFLIVLNSKPPSRFRRFINWITRKKQIVTVLANVASGAQVYKYNKYFDDVEKAKAFAQEEFDLFVKGESLSV